MKIYKIDKNIILASLKNGNLYWYKDDKLHRDDDLPAIIHTDGYKAWYKDGKLHRDDGPAKIYSSGSKFWFKDDKLHRENDLPAVIYPDGYKAWWKEGKRHRENGPACIWSDDKKQYWLNGIQYSKFDYDMLTFNKTIDEIFTL